MEGSICSSGKEKAMKSKRFNAGWALLAMLLVLTACGAGEPTREVALTPTFTHTPTAGATHEDLLMVPFTAGGFSGVVPQGWAETEPGEFVRESSGGDHTVFVQQSAPGMTIEQVKEGLLPLLGQEEFPEQVGTVATGHFTWELYTTQRDEPDAGKMMVDLALAQADVWVHVVALQATPEEYAALHQAVFLPALDAFAPVGLAVEAAGEPAYVYRVPEQLDDGWPTASLDAVGIDSATITRLTDQIVNGQYEGIRSLLIVKDGALVHEAYFGGYDRDSLHSIYSISKSVTSALIGIAIEAGYIQGVDATLLALLPQYAAQMGDEGKREITLEQLLTMTSGLEWDESTYSYSDPRNSHYYLERAGDWMAYVISRPLQDTPGTQFTYNTGAVHLLGAVIERSTGQHANRFAREHLFKPLGIVSYIWPGDPQGYPYAGGSEGGLRLKARDLAKFGYLYLNAGRWNGQQVIPEDWVAASTQPRVELGPGSSYGYLWWLGSFTIKGRHLDFINAEGYGGQLVNLVPELDLMVVFTSWGEERGADIAGPLMTIYRAALGD
jgi:CubicO group peptidase (beta-lactamase class C family)